MSSLPRTSPNDRLAMGHGTVVRKDHHLDICLQPDRFDIEAGVATGFDELRLVHDALPELDAGAVDTGVTMLGQRLRCPLFISCMTGGSGRGREANRLLAAAAQEAGVAVGLGSMRPLLEDEATFDHFHVKPLARDVPVMANIGAAQVRDYGAERILYLARRLEVQALVVHLNAGQELFQPEGDHDFRGLRAAIGDLIADSLPIIIKETGFGIRPRLVRDLLRAGAEYVDVAGAGGTNWVLVEGYRLPPAEAEAARAFEAWGLPTAVLLAALPDCTGKLLASGGLRDGVQLAKALALGAAAGGMAIPFIRDAIEGGVASVVERIEAVAHSLRAAMALTGATDVAELRTRLLLRSLRFRHDVAELDAVEG